MKERAHPADLLSSYLKRVLPPPDGEELPGRIQVRRFAGPLAYVDRIEPIRVAHLTDLHVGRVTPLAVQRAAVALTNAEKPDLVVITGDFVCHSQMYLDELEGIVRGFSAPVVSVLGNHDHWSGAPEVTRSLTRAGALVLQNHTTTIRVRGQAIQMVGLDDAYTGHADRERTLRGYARDVPSLGLSHIAEEADGLFAHGVPLVLSGHTHAGQVTLARMHEIAFGRITGHRYVHGLYGTRGVGGEGAPGGAVYVGAGIGASVIPLRLGERARREVTIFELGRAPGSFDEHHREQLPLAGRKPSARAMARRAAAVETNRAHRARRDAGRRGG